VDDELRPQDAARVEDLCKRDPELRAEIEDYRRLRGKLKAWDAENTLTPEPTLLRRALDRARTYATEQREARKGRVLHLLFHPAAMAASLLLAAAVGVFAGRDAPVARVESARLEITPAAPVGDLSVAADLAPAPPLPSYVSGPSAYEYVRKRILGRWVDGVVMSDLAIRLYEEQENEIRQWERRKLEQEPVAVKEDPERPRTGAWNREVLAMLDPFKPGAEPIEGVVTVRRPVDPALPEFHAARAAEEGSDPDRLTVDVAGDREPVLVPLGQVWIGTRDKSLRTRVVAVSNLVFDTEFVASAWADRIPRPYDSRKLDSSEFILGPEARRRLASARGKDEEFVAWLHRHYGVGSLAEAYARGAAARNREVAALVAALDEDRESTGFAVVGSDDRVLGVELFADHALMMKFAPHLLHGYLIESGDTIRVKRRKEAANAAASARVGAATRALGDTAKRAVRVDVIKEDGTTKGWPGSLPDLRRVNLRDGNGEILAHGVLNGDRPIHLTIFE